MTSLPRSAGALARPVVRPAIRPSRPIGRKPRPVLLFLVYGVFLVIVGVTATAQVMLASVHVSTSALNQAVVTDTQVVRGFVDDLLKPADLTAPSIAADRQSALETASSRSSRRAGSSGPRSGASTGPSSRATPRSPGCAVPNSADWQTALAGHTAVSLAAVAESEAGPGDLGTATVIREYLPLIQDGEVVGVVGVWRDATPIIIAIDAARRDVMVVTVSAPRSRPRACCTSSSGPRRNGSPARRSRSSRRPGATRSPGCSTTAPWSRPSAPRSSAFAGPDGGLEIAILDIDNFRILNDTWGHAAGDEAIRAVQAQLEPLVSARWRSAATARTSSSWWSRGGGRDARAPDRVGAPGARGRSASASATATTCRSRSAAPVARFPEDGDSVTELLANAAVTLREARAGGGDAVLVTGFEPGRVPSHTFDVFQGLILAVDAKDRYTKRHSEDVARYAMFIGSKLGIGAEEIGILRLAGLLHDVGKVGIPDQILRKPGKLTDGEYEIVKQHVALGDSILRDLPDLDAIRAGVRHHHERWDGRGYLHALAGDDIPLFARILAVADTFSAMTTSRPYRKALDLREARLRLEDAAGTQLDERLVAAFLDGLETDANPPLPGDEAAGRLWLPGRGSRDYRRAVTLAAGRLGSARRVAAPRRLRRRPSSPSRPRCSGCRSTCCRFRCPTPIPSCTTGSCTSIARACWPTTSTPTAISWRRGWSRARRTATWTSTTTGRSRTEPDHGYTGLDSFTYQAHDGTIGVATVVTFTVTNVAPVGHNDHYTTKEGVKLQVDRPGVLKNDDDADGDHLKAKLVSGPDHGKLDLHARASSTTSPPRGSRARTCSPTGPSTAPTSPRSSAS